MNDDKNNKDKTINIRDVIAITNIYNIEIYPIGTYPVQSYSSKSTSVTKFLAWCSKEENELSAKENIIKAPEIYDNIFSTIFNLYDYIEKNLYSNIKPEMQKWVVDNGKGEPRKKQKLFIVHFPKIKLRLI